MKKLALIAATSMALAMSTANAADMYHLKVEYLLGGKIQGNYSTDVPLGVESNFGSTHTREVTSDMNFVDEVKAPLQTGFLFN